MISADVSRDFSALAFRCQLREGPRTMVFCIVKSAESRKRLVMIYGLPFSV
jgi:hypothetical protein